jgi:hypothetical protein
MLTLPLGPNNPFGSVWIDLSEPTTKFLGGFVILAFETAKIVTPYGSLIWPARCA